MQPDFYSREANAFTGGGEGFGRSRLTAALLSLAMVALFLFLMIEMGLVSLGTSGAGTKLTSVALSASTGAAQKRVKAHASASHQTSQPQPQQAQPKPPRPLWLSHDDFAATDISHMARHDEDSGDASGQDSGSTYGPGEGPGGAQLYNAAWYREPSNAELATYMPERVEPGSWATIACRMVENFHVEDCRELDESPPGSGLARALRLASWQFLVRPPRVNGQAKLGTWVRIRFDFTRPGGG